MAAQKPLRVLDLYCGASPPVVTALRRRFPRRPLEYVGIDSLGRPSFENRSLSGFHYRYVDAVISPDHSGSVSKLFGQFQDGYFDEIHIHMPGTNSVSSDDGFRMEISRLLKTNGRLYATIQSGSPLFSFLLHRLPGGQAGEDELFLHNRSNLQRAGEASGMRLEKYGARLGESARWITRERDFLESNDYEQRKILDALKQHSGSASFANHFVVFRRMR